MARNPKVKITTKKHLARQEREQLQRRYILTASAIVIAIVVLLVVYGALDQTVLQARQPVAVVNGENISTREFQGQARFARYTLLRNAVNTFEFMQFFGSDPSTQASFISQLQQIQIQMQPTMIGQDVLNRMSDDALIRQEAARRGITVTEEEIQASLQENFGYFPDGTPTPSPTAETIPTSTLSPLQQTLMPPTATPTSTPVPTTTVEITGTVDVTGTAPLTETVTATPEFTPTPDADATPTATSTPVPTPTPFTLEGFQTLYQDTVKGFESEYGITEADLRYVIEMEIYREKVMEAVLADVDIPREEEQVWARHILVESEELATDIVGMLNEGEPFAELASRFSTDTSNKDQGGDLQWFSRGAMVPQFDEAVFALEVGEISEPVQTQFGWHVIQLLGKETRPLSDESYEELRAEKFNEWLSQLRDNAEIEVKDYWRTRAPTEPKLPVEIETMIQNAQVAPSSLPVLPMEDPEDIETP